jgi:hypothetical protein
MLTTIGSIYLTEKLNKITIMIAKFDFLMNKQKHLIWKFKLRRFLDGEDALTMEQAVCHTECDLGKWLYSEGLKRYAHLPEMEELERVHFALHQEVKNIIHLKENGKYEEANTAYAHLLSISDKLVCLLDYLANIDKIEQKKN